MFAKTGILLLVGAVVLPSCAQEVSTNIDGDYSVLEGRHYANKTSLSWGMNNETLFSVQVSLSESCASYNCSETCEDDVWYYDWNKLWGKTRCGYANGNHQDSDRFVFRRCSDPTCSAYVEGQSPRIQIAGYSYDDGRNPYSDDPSLLQPFNTLLDPDVTYGLSIEMDQAGLTTYTLLSNSDDVLESQYVQHSNTCPENYYEGAVQGLYFGGTCRAPEVVSVHYQS